LDRREQPAEADQVVEGLREHLAAVAGRGDAGGSVNLAADS
jgi:hypothetical protein